MFGFEIIDAGLIPAMTVALLAGVLSFLSPCVLPIVPPYLAYMGGITMAEMDGTKAARRETLGLRMQRHCENALKVAQWLENDPRVETVTYAGLDSSPWKATADRLYPKGVGGLFTFAIKGGYESAVKLVSGLDLFSHVANLGDARSLVIHSASTTHRQLTEDQQRAAGAGPEILRLSVGIEDADDLIADLDQALAKATA